MTRGRRVALVIVAAAAVLAALPPALLGGSRALALAARATLVVGVSSASLGLVSGALLALAGLALGARGRLVVTRIAEALGALPTVLVVPLLAAAPLGPPAVRVAVALSLARAAEAMHLVLLEARSLSGERWVEASLALGARRLELVRTHLLPRVAPLLGAAALSGCAAAIPLEIAVAFLGLAPASGLGAYASTALARREVGPLLLVALTAGAISAALSALGGAARGPRS